jgi:hypothetical protein
MMVAALSKRRSVMEVASSTPIPPAPTSPRTTARTDFSRANRLVLERCWGLVSGSVQRLSTPLSGRSARVRRHGSFNRTPERSASVESVTAFDDYSAKREIQPGGRDAAGSVLVDRSVELVEADAAAILLADPAGNLRVMAASSEQARLLELVQLQNEEGPCFEAYLRGEMIGHPDLGRGAVMAPVRTRGSQGRLRGGLRPPASASIHGYRRAGPVPFEGLLDSRGQPAPGPGAG